MMSIFGIRFGKRNESDDEYVARIRKHDRMIRKSTYFWLALALAHLVLIVWLFDLLINVADMVSRVGEHNSSGHWWGFTFGTVFGLWFCLIFFQGAQALKHWLEGKTGFRTERLLLKYYDLASKRVGEMR